MDKFNQFELYNNAYKKFTPDWVSLENIDNVNSQISLENSTLIDFTHQILEQFNIGENVASYDLLELGCGLGAISLNFSDQFRSVTGVDISSLAIAMAQEIANLKCKEVTYKQLDIQSGKSLGKKFDLIIDSHLLHCLVTPEGRTQYFKFLVQHLEDKGRVIIETMAFQKGLQFPVGYEFTQDNVLLKTIDEKEYPIRAIYDSITIENEIKKAGLKIDYLYYHNEISFEVFDEYKDYPAEYLPKMLRISLSLG